jgi:hypothetical protein
MQSKDQYFSVKSYNNLPDYEKDMLWEGSNVFPGRAVKGLRQMFLNLVQGLHAMYFNMNQAYNKQSALPSRRRKGKGKEEKEEEEDEEDNDPIEAACRAYKASR